MTQKRTDTYNNLPLDPDGVRAQGVVRPPHFRPSVQLAVFAGGSIGTYMRYCVSLILPTQPHILAIGTLIVNLVGAFILGVLLEYVAKNDVPTARKKLLQFGVGTGVIGGFTSYSTFAVESVLLLKNGDRLTAGIYMLVTVLGGLVATVLGIYTASRVSEGART